MSLKFPFWAGEMALSEKCLAHKHEDLCVDLQYPHKKPATAESAWRSQEAGNGGC